MSDVLETTYLPFFTSFLFVLPAYYAYISPGQQDVFIASIVCLITSVANHYTKCKNPIIRKIDIVTVVSIATYYILYTAFHYGCKKSACLVYLFALLAGVVYLKNTDDNCHSFVHLFSILGVLCYIYTRRQF